VTELKERTRRFESIFNQTFQFTGLLDTDGTVREMNEAGLEFSGTDRTDIVGAGFDEMQWWDHSEQTREEAMEALDRATRGNFVRYETEAMGADGIRTIDLSLKPVLDDDGGVSLLVFEGRDITDRQRRGQHLAVLERVMRHNIRNDLTKLRGWTQMLFEADAEADREAKYATVQKILDRWEQLTDRIRHIRHLLDSQAVHDETRTLSTVVDDAVAATRDAHPDAAVTTDVEQCGRAMVPVILEEAIRELLSNAVTASEESPVAVDCHRPSDEWIELTVADRGPGLPDAEAEVLTTGEETPLSHGQGLGLWMVRMVTSEIGGDVSVDGSADGTRITLRIPTRSPISDTGAKQ
jgi:PAS domain S-box-containing protein